MWSGDMWAAGLWAGGFPDRRSNMANFVFAPSPSGVLVTSAEMDSQMAQQAFL